MAQTMSVSSQLRDHNGTWDKIKEITAMTFLLAALNCQSSTGGDWTNETFSHLPWLVAKREKNSFFKLLPLTWNTFIEFHSLYYNSYEYLINFIIALFQRTWQTCMRSYVCYIQLMFIFNFCSFVFAE